MFEQLEKTFDLIPAEPKTPDVVQEMHPPLVVEPNAEEEAKDKADRELARDTFKKLIEKSENMLNVLIQIAGDSEHPRAFEVAATLVRTIGEVATKLDESASKKDKQRQKDSGSQEATINNSTHNHLYVGSSEDLMKLIRNKGESPN